MTWILLIHVFMATTCTEGYRLCPPAKPPITSQHRFASEKACLFALEHMRQRFPERREVMRTGHIVMEQQTTLRCVSQAKE